MYEKELQDLGLSEKEAKVYLTALEMGAETAQNIAKKANVNRATTYVQIDSLKAKGFDLVITVDCGAMAHKPLEHAASIGLDVVVIDHHLMREDPPKARAVVNPNRPGCTSDQGNLAAAGGRRPEAAGRAGPRTSDLG